MGPRRVGPRRVGDPKFRVFFWGETKGIEKNSSEQKLSTLAQELTRAQHTGTRRPLHERGDPHHPRRVDV